MKAKKRLKNMIYKLPFSISKFFLYHVWKPLDFFYPELKRQGLPPMSLVRYGGYGTSLKMANNFVALVERECGLQTGSVVLDLGCGAGFLHVPLLKIIGTTGKLEALDIIKESINWCKDNIQAIYPNTNYSHSDIFNASYNPTGHISAENYKFPYADQTFDVVLLKSVFTHMRPKEVSNYVSEIARVLKSGGRALITFFFINEGRQYISKGKSSLNFSHKFQGCLVVNPEIPEDAIAYEQSFLKTIVAKQGMSVKKIILGNWCNDEEGREAETFQDVVVLLK